MIALIDYGMGNLHSVAKALEAAGGKVRLVRKASDMKNSSRIVLPGVGAFRDCIGTLQRQGLDSILLEKIRQGFPYLGICLGMQVLMDASLEFGRYNGLGLISGTVVPFPTTHPGLGYKIPHMGWNDVVLSSKTDPHPVLRPLHSDQAYFVHSFVCRPDNPEHILAACSYGNYPFAAAIGRDNFIGVQFHPEKSQAAGIRLLEGFIKWNP
ncbi:MAG: imidazole glycerol phosphate synthase subunit HisH [Mariprofundaceae bacterium]